MTSRPRHHPWSTVGGSLLILLFLCFPVPLLAEDIAILKSADIGAYTEAIEGFKANLRPTAKIILEYDLQGDLTQGRQLAQRIRASNAKLVLAVGLKAALAAKLEILDTPVIFSLVLSPDTYGLPSGNMVGLSLDIPFRQQINPVRALLPNMSKVGVLFDPQKTGHLVTRLQDEAHDAGITILAQEVKSEQAISKALNTLLPSIDVLWLLPDSTVLTEHSLEFLMSRTLEHRIPVVGFSAGLVKSGALVATHLKYFDIGRQAATLADHLLDNPGSARLGTTISPDTLHRSLNRRIADFLDVPLSSQLLRQFDEQF
jgi:putative tryptophan/tyrosine transport system substrate-binding protein